MNDRTRSAVALEVDIAATRATRRRGLLGRESLGAAEGLLLTPCKAAQNDGNVVLYRDRDGRAVRIVPALAPWRIAMSILAKAVIELAAGTAAAADIQIGDMLYLAPAPPPRKRTEAVTRDTPRKPETAPKGVASLKAPATIEEHPRC